MLGTRSCFPIAVLVALLQFLPACSCSDTGIHGDTGLENDVTGIDVPTSDASWDPLIENLGEPGWRESSEPLCNPAGRFQGFDVWSDHRGVFVLLSIMDDIDTDIVQTVYFNGGTGWSEYNASLGIDHESCVHLITGTPGGALFGWGPAYCFLSTITADSVDYEGFEVWDVFAVNESLTYATMLGDPRLVMNDGVSWGPYPGEALPYQVRLVWADEENIFCAGDSGIILSREGGLWIVHDTGTMDTFTAIWGFSGDDIWAGTWEGNLLRYNGEVWERIEWPVPGDSSDPESCRYPDPGIEGMWGVEDYLFFHTSDALMMWDGASFSALGYWPGEDASLDCSGRLQVNAIWGNSADEIFLAVLDTHEIDYPGVGCQRYVLWWDGHEFHWF